MAIKTFTVSHSKDNFVFIPACCYAGNQFKVKKCSYPPMFSSEDISVDMPTVISDVPRLEPDGSGKIEVTTGDAAVPCIGVFFPSQKKGLLVFTVQQIKGKNIGLAYENGEIRLTWPAKREKIYSMCSLNHNPEEWVDEPTDIPYKLLDFSCGCLADFYRVFFENRKCMGLDCTRPSVLPFEEQFAIHQKKFNTKNWHETFEFYTIGTDHSHFQTWQPGWVGGAVSGYPLMKLGGKMEAERAIKTLNFLFSTQCESGFFHGIIDYEGNIFDDGFGYPDTKNWHLIRKSADVLYSVFKHFEIMKQRDIEIPESFILGTKKTADAFVQLFHKFGQFGQFVNVYTGEIRIGGSASAAIAPAALAKAYQFFENLDYLQTAKESAELYYQTFLCKGYTTGGPGEALQCADSESAFGLLESFVILYEVTNEEKWMKYAKECAHYCSSWVVSYNYVFPKNSEFGVHDMKTVGSVFANLQNKHSAPGICTLSGDSLYKLWKYTKDALYLELLKDIALTIGQYMSTDEKPIYNWKLDWSLRNGQNPEILEQFRLPEGFINERVNMSDWEGEKKVGGVFNGSCWCETSNMLCLAEVIPLLNSDETDKSLA